jgi:DNA-binding GntR family transcriptional regulator
MREVRSGGWSTLWVDITGIASGPGLSCPVRGPGEGKGRHPDVRRLLHERVSRRRLPAARHRLPSEVELAQQYGVARMTVRRAVAQLRDKGLVVTVHGRGPFVAPRNDQMR